MAVKKKRAIPKSKKKIVRKQRQADVLEKGVLEEKPQAQEAQKDVAPPAEAPISESVGGPVIIPSGVIQDTAKEQQSQSEPESPKVEQSLSQLPQQAADILVSHPESAATTTPSVEPVATQDPFADGGVVRDKKDEEDIEEPKKKRLWILIAIIFIVVVLIAGALWYFRENAIKQVSLEDKITSTPAPSRVSPTPASDSAKLAIDYSKYKIKVLNGSGIGGAAAKGKEILESGKFIVDEIGNAKTSDYEETIIQAKKKVPSAFLDKLKSALEKSYVLGSSEELEDSEEVDVVVIIGSGKKPLN